MGKLNNTNIDGYGKALTVYINSTFLVLFSSLINNNKAFQIYILDFEDRIRLSLLRS